MTKELSWGFLTLFLILALTTGYLIYMLKLQFEKQINIERSFKKEACNLIFILVFFGSTYLLRFFSDYFAVPVLVQEGVDKSMNPSTYCKPIVEITKGHPVPMVCPTFTFMLYFMITTLFWDLFPIGLLLIFHYRNFKTSSQYTNVDP